MEELLEALVGAIAELFLGALGKEGRTFLRDVGAILAGRKVQNRRRDGPVC